MLGLEETITSLSTKLLGLAPGPIAELRRMPPDGAGTPVFWRLAVQHEFRDSDLHTWKQIIRILALLTPRGNLGGDAKLHERSRHLGTVLCDGGNLAWPPPGPEPNPVVSEKRLARFLAMSTAQRGEALERIVRMLARTRNPQSGVNCIEIARLLLYPDNVRPLHDIAHDYYSKLDRTAKQSKKEEGTA